MNYLKIFTLEYELLIVLIFRLRMPQKKFLKDPEYAIECCLPDITSPNEVSVS